MRQTIDKELAKRPLPSFQQWIDEKNGGVRGPGYDDFASLRDLAERTLLRSDEGLPVEQASFLRLWMGFLVATVELCNIERGKDAPVEVITAMMPRALACAAVYAMASVVTDEAPMRDIAKILTEEFRFAAKQAADDLTERSA